MRQGETGIAGPDVDHVQGREAAAFGDGVADRLAIEGHHFILVQRPAEQPGELPEGGFEGLRIEKAEDATEGVVAGHAVFQRQQLLQELLLGFDELGDLQARPGAGDGGAQGHEDDVEQLVACIGGTRILDGRKHRTQMFEPVLVVVASHFGFLRGDSKEFPKKPHKLLRCFKNFDMRIPCPGGGRKRRLRPAR